MHGAGLGQDLSPRVRSSHLQQVWMNLHSVRVHDVLLKLKSRQMFGAVGWGGGAEAGGRCGRLLLAVGVVALVAGGTAEALR